VKVPATAPPLRLAYKAGGRNASLAVQPGGVLLGRQDTCDIVLAGADVSRQHAEIRCVQGRWILRDLGSSNGTRVGAERVSEHALRHGDRIHIGSHEIACDCESGAAPEIADDAGAVPEARLDMQDMGQVLGSVLPAQAGGAALPAATLLDLPRGVSGATLGPGAAPADARWVLQMLHDAMGALMEREELDPLLERVVDLVFEHLPAERCFVMLYDSASDELSPRVQRVRPGKQSGPLRISRHIADLVLKSRQSVLVRDARSDERLMAAESIVSLDIRSALCAPLYHKGRVGGLVYADRSSGLQAFTSTQLAVLSILASISAAAVERAQLRESLQRERRNRERLARYHAPSVVERIIRAVDQDEGTMEAEERVVTVLFADLSGFTQRSECMAPREVTAMLNELFEMLTEEVFREGGTLDKFIGDALMVFFGAPIPQPDHALRAVRAARGMLARLAEFNAARPPAAHLGVRIGINTGPVVVGDVGALQRRDYTVIGDTVNVASRLESSVAQVGQIVIGPETFEGVRASFACTPIEPLRLKGKSQPFQPFLVG
jgi:adenylate cyclase